jgi:hypothetical protein
VFAWKQLIHEADSLFPNQVGFLFFIQPKNKKELQYILRALYKRQIRGEKIK